MRDENRRRIADAVSLFRPGKCRGHHTGVPTSGAIGLAVFTDESKATEYANFHLGLLPRQFADKDDFLEYLRSLTGQYDQVTIDPKTNRLGTITPLDHLVELLEAAESA